MRDATAGARPRFLPPPVAEPRSFVIVRRGVALLVALFLAVGALSSYRAYVQVQRLELGASDVLRVGAPVRAEVVSSGRAPVSMTVELVQGARAETLGVTRLAGNRNGFFDFRPKHSSISATISPALVAPFEPGPAVVRATARGTSQWLRVPPPEVREVPVRIERGGDGDGDRAPR